MSGYFQRPSLRADTFQNDQKTAGAGLKAAFQNRTSPSDPHHYGHLNVIPPTSTLKGAFENRSFIGTQTSKHHDSINRPAEGGLKAVFDRRRSGEPSGIQSKPNNLGGGLKASFETRNHNNQNEEPSTSGLKSAVKKSQGLGKMSNDLYRSDSNPSTHSHYRNNDFLPDTDSEDMRPNNDTDEQPTFPSDYPTGFHSIHRLSELSNRQGGNSLKHFVEARTGGTTRRNLGTRNNQKDSILENHANLIVSKMEQDEALMEDSLEAEELRRTALRDMPQCLTIKRCVKVKLSKSVSKKSKRKPIGWYKMFKYRMSMAMEKLKINIKDLAYSFELWYDPLKKIEGNFGTGVASFFKFLRWLFLVNLMIAILSVSFIVIPKAVYSPTVQDKVSWENALKDIFTGEGFLTNSVMYYGYYTNEIFNSDSATPYSMSQAYLFTMVVIYFVSFAVFGISAAKSYKRSFIETEGGLKNVFANKIFCGWDYNIATKDAAILKSNSIFNELRELLSEYAWKNKNTSFCLRLQTAIVQLAMNILILVLMGGTAVAIWYFLDRVPAKGGSVILTSLFINAVMTFLPMFLSFVVKYEEYKNPKLTLYFTLARTFVLGAVTVGVLIAYWLRNNSSSPCWETSLAQEIYRMIIFDFVISVLFAALLDVCLYGIYRLRRDTNLEFDIAWHTMQLIYNQTLFWVGLVVSPILPVVVVIKLLFTWYIRQWVVLYLCKPSARSWRAAQTSTWFLVMAFLSLLCIGGVLGYIVSYIPVSQGCGPFRNFSYIYEAVTEGLLRLKSNGVWQVVLYVTKPGVIALILIAMCAGVYYLRAKANAQKEIVAQCRDMLVNSAKDKEFYFSMISQATNGQWQYRLHDQTVNPELYSPDLNISHEEGDTRGTSIASQYNNMPSSTSGTILGPSLSTSSFELDESPMYSSHKKYS